MPTISFDREVVLDELSCIRLIKKIEYDQKHKSTLKYVNIDKKLEEGRELLKRLVLK